MTHPYKITYKINTLDPNLTADQVRKLAAQDDAGAASSLFFVSVIEPEGGGLSVAFSSAARVDGELGPHPEQAKMWFKIWLLLGSSLSSSEDISPTHREYCQKTVADFTKSLFGRH